MLYTTLHNRILRLVLAVLGELIAAAALNLFIVPLSLYTGGLLGFCQLVRTLLQETRELAALTAHYYDRSYHRHERYTL